MKYFGGRYVVSVIRDRSTGTAIVLLSVTTPGVRFVFLIVAIVFAVVTEGIEIELTSAEEVREF